MLPLRISLTKLIADGRIHPVRIEDMVTKAKEEVEKKIFQEGENAAMDVGVMNLPKELVKTLGRSLNARKYPMLIMRS